MGGDWVLTTRATVPRGERVERASDVIRASGDAMQMPMGRPGESRK